jgi:hypothetical protein
MRHVVRLHRYDDEQKSSNVVNGIAMCADVLSEKEERRKNPRYLHGRERKKEKKERKKEKKERKKEESINE